MGYFFNKVEKRKHNKSKWKKNWKERLGGKKPDGHDLIATASATQKNGNNV